jgi:CO/xanthine dehydrogenase FAD-binding subunit
MFTIETLYQPQTLSELKEILEKHPDITVLGGCGFLKLGNRKISFAVDLSRCELDKICETEHQFEFGAMVTLRDIERNQSLNHFFSGALPKAVSNILGVQFRSCATIGASVYSKYGFSDILPVLLALDSQVELLRGGRMSLEEFLGKPVSRDVLTRITITKDERRVSYQNLRNAGADFPMLNAAVSRHGSEWKVIVGARPARAEIAFQAGKILANSPDDSVESNAAAVAAAEELTFGSNNKASAEYRQAMCQVLVKRAIEEVVQ